MQIKSNLVTETLFNDPTGYVNKNTFFARPSPAYREDYIDYDVPEQKPVAVEVNSMTKNIDNLTSSVNSNISYAISRNSATQSFISDAMSITAQIKELAEKAAESTTDDTAREQLNTEAQNLLSKLDDIYVNSSYNGEYVMRGGGGSFAGGIDGGTFTYSNGNASRSTLGIDNISISTKTDAESALTSVDSAYTLLQGQYSLAYNEGQGFTDTYTVNEQSLEGVRSNANVEATVGYNLTAMENSVAVVSREMVFALGIQSSSLKDNILKNMASALENISQAVKDVQEKSENIPQEEKDKEKAVQLEEQLNKYAQDNMALERSLLSAIPKPNTDNFGLSSKAYDFVYIDNTTEDINSITNNNNNNNNNSATNSATTTSSSSTNS